MKYPTLPTRSSNREMLDAFKGYNHNLLIGEGEFFDMKNMTSDHYPLLAPRGKRGVYASPESAQGLIAKVTLCYVDGENFVMDGYPIAMGLSTDAEDCPKKLISMGAYVIILPDKKYINTADITDFGNIVAEFTTGNPVSFTLCRLDGSEYIVEYMQPDEPGEPANMTLWIDTSSTPHSLRQWSETSGMWVSIATCYVKISSPGIGKAFEKYDGITISGLKDTELMDADTGDQQLSAPTGVLYVDGGGLAVYFHFRHEPVGAGQELAENNVGIGQRISLLGENGWKIDAVHGKIVIARTPFVNKGRARR